jgi:hypothetical protein
MSFHSNYAHHVSVCRYRHSEDEYQELGSSMEKQSLHATPQFLFTYIGYSSARVLS